MKIRWRKVAPGIYQSDTGRFAIHKNGSQGWYGHAPEWVVSDSNVIVASCDSLKAAKKFIDDRLELEANRV